MTSGVSFESGKRVLRVLNKPTLPFNYPLAAYVCPCVRCVRGRKTVHLHRTLRRETRVWCRGVSRVRICP